ncbi:MAG: SIS domain-containing protein [Clostridiales bacterium]|nr:SIS domain-containing protein [Clostridiales bacterium]MDD7432875.1 SIS domain-containing protein [Clostridiales bacterium]MDY3061568.1 6-phospho-3-hexuloisomerase [Eubacteriales bacterium]
MSESDQYKDCKTLVLSEISSALERVSDDDTEKLCRLLDEAEQIFFVGVGRVLLSLEAMAKRLSHLGYKTHIVGDINEPAITEKDLLIVGSGSGSSLFPLAIAKKAHSLGVKVVHIGSNPRSEMANLTTLMVRIPVRTKLYLADEIPSDQPMTSLFEQSLLLFGDILALMLIRRKKLDLKELWRCHANLE